MKDMVFCLLETFETYAGGGDWWRSGSWCWSASNERDISKAFSPIGAAVSGVSGEKQEISFSRGIHSFRSGARVVVVAGDGVEGDSCGKDGLRGDFMDRPSSGERRYVHHPWEWGLSSSAWVLTLRRPGCWLFWVGRTVSGDWGGLSSSQIDAVERARPFLSTPVFWYPASGARILVAAECCAGIAGTGGTSVSYCHRRGVGCE